VRCPNCAEDNIPGADLCQQCGADLAGLDLPEAGSGFRGRLLSDHLGDLALSPHLTLDGGASVAEGIALMRREGHGCVLVQEEGKLAGIFTERDLLSRVVCRGGDTGQTLLREVMTPDPTTVAATDPPAFAVYLTVRDGIRHLPVVEGDRLLGIVSVRNLLRYIHHDIITARAPNAAP
jgi:signal-transduction protein with cAMP-binding, CBS, and nucleotidyltransferase domain